MSLASRVVAALGAFTQPLPAARRVRPTSIRKIQREFMRIGAGGAGFATRSYAGAQFDRLTEDFLSPLTTGDAELRTRIRILRQRARELERNEPYSRRYLSRLEDNIYDHHGMTFVSAAAEWRKTDGRLGLVIDENDSAIIESAYREWRKNPFVTEDMDLNEGGRLSLRSVARDGDMFVRPVYGRQYKDGIALQLLEADMCDDNRNAIERDGRGGVESQIRMGVEVDRVFKATGYWMLKNHPGDQQWWFGDGYISERHPADEFFHPFHRTRITQCRDATWLCAIMRDLKLLDGYDEAAIVAARVGAAKMGFFTRDYNDPGAPYTGEEDNDASEAGDKAMDAEPGLIEDLSQEPGLKFSGWDPSYPHEQYPAFVKARLRRIGAALDMSYYAVANDLTEVNFSSIRAGLLEDRERFKTLQTWWIGRYESPIFLRWLETALINGTLKDPVTFAPLPFSKLEKFARHEFRPRRWPWVDPEKDVNADVLAINNRLKSRSQVIAENSQDSFSKVVHEQAAEQELAADLDVDLPEPPPPNGTPAKEDDDEDPKSKKKPGKGSEE